jgi:hypothetical protein
VVPGVIGERVALPQRALEDGGAARHLLADEKERGVDAVALEDVEDLVGIGARPVVERQRDDPARARPVAERPRRAGAASRRSRRQKRRGDVARVGQAVTAHGSPGGASAGVGPCRGHDPAEPAGAQANGRGGEPRGERAQVVSLQRGRQRARGAAGAGGRERRPAPRRGASADVASRALEEDQAQRASPPRGQDARGPVPARAQREDQVLAVLTDRGRCEVEG